METLPYQEDELDSDVEETTNTLNQSTYNLTIPLPYGREAPPPDDSILVANEALFQVAQDALTKFFATLPNNLRRGTALVEKNSDQINKNQHKSVDFFCWFGHVDLGTFEHKSVDFLTKQCWILTKKCSFSNKKVLIFLLIWTF